MRQVIEEPIVITGIGMITSVGNSREESWQAIQAGTSDVSRLTGLPGIPDNLLIGAVVRDLPSDQRMKVFEICERAAAEAIADARLDFTNLDPERFGCSLSAHMGDTSWLHRKSRSQSLYDTPWWKQWFPNSSCTEIAQKYNLLGPRLSHSTACASSLVSILAAVRSIRNRQCDIALAGGGDAIDPLVAAGFNQMRVLAKHDDPNQASRPFDRNRNGFVLGEGGAILVVERLGHALRRGARIYAEIAAGKMLSEAHHVTGLDSESDALSHLISITLEDAGLAPADVGYINAHGTGTDQNDRFESRAIRSALGPAANDVCVSSSKSMLGHMINAAGGAALAITALAPPDGIAPPTRNLTDPDPECTLDCVPHVGRVNRFQNALKISVAFGGHLVAVALRRWNDAATGFQYPAQRKAA